MTGFTWQQPWAFAALLLVPALALLFRQARRKREAQLRAYGGQRGAKVTARSRERRRGEWCVVAAAALLALALARPGANPRPSSTPEGGRDLVFVLDVSRSMLAADVHPSRLERAKEEVSLCVASLKNDRVGLVVFAGAAAIRCPLTTDYEFFRMMLKDAAPESVAHGSTYLQSALEKTTDRMLNTNRAGLEDVILLTDGEDQGSHPDQTLAGLNAAGARLLVVGYGDPTIGARIPASADAGAGFLMYENQEVWTRLQAASLQSLAGAAGQGDYVRGGTPGFDLGRTYQKWSAAAPRRFLHGCGTTEYDEYFAWLLVPALGLLLYPFAGLRRWPVSGLLGCLLAGQLHAAAATNELEQLRAAVPAAADSQSHGERAFQLGLALMKSQSFADAAKAFESAVQDASSAEGTAVGNFNQALAEAALAAHAHDPAAELHSLDPAMAMLRRVRLLRPDWLAPAQALEVLYVRQAAAAAALKTQQDQQQQMNKDAQALTQELQRLLAEQRKLLAAGTQLQRDSAMPDAAKLDALKSLRARQDELGQETERARGKMISVRDALRDIIRKLGADETRSLPAETIPTGLEEPLLHVTLARAAQDRAVKWLGPLDQLKPAVQAKQEAVTELEAAVAALAAGQSGQDDQKSADSDDSDQSDSSASDNAASQSMPMKSDFLSDPVNRALPKPNFSPAEILQEEQANAQSRTKNQPARVGKGEKDW